MTVDGSVRSDLEYLVQLGLVRGARVVELGCGTGTLSRELAAVVGPSGAVCGVDTAAFNVARARELGVQAGQPHASYEVADLAATGLAADFADLVLARGLLGRVTRPPAVVREMVRITRPGGVVVLIDEDEGLVTYQPEPPALTELRALLGERSREAGFEPDVGRHLFSYLVGVGLEEVRVVPRAWVACREPLASTAAEVPRDLNRGHYGDCLSRKVDLLAENGLLSRDETRRFRKALEEIWSAASYFMFSCDFVAWGTKPLRCA